MALLTEQPISGLSDWMAYDSKLSILSEQESASVERKGELAQQEISTEVLAFLLRNSAVSDSTVRGLVDKVHVSEPIRRWHIYLTLSLYYADLASLQASALHREQSRYFELRADEARDQAFVTGIGIVNSPVPRGYAPNATLAGEEDTSRLLRLRVKFRDEAGAEGSASDEFVMRPPSSGALLLSFANLPTNVAGWQLFVAEDSDTFRALSDETFERDETVSLAPVFGPSGSNLRPDGQGPDRHIYLTRSFGR